MGADEFAMDMNNKSLFEDSLSSPLNKKILDKLKKEAISNTNSTEEATDYYDKAINNFQKRYLESMEKPTVHIDLAKSTDISHDPVNHPNHYCTGKYECMGVMEEVFGREKFMDYCYLNAFKYIWRSERKNGIEDIKKAIFYLNKFVEMYEKNREEK